MKISISFLFLGLTAFAETYEYKVDGMTCSACKSFVKSSVCELPGVKSCDVQAGSIKLTSVDGQTIDQAAVTKALEDLNKQKKKEYKIISSAKVEEGTVETAPRVDSTKPTNGKDSTKVKK